MRIRQRQKTLDVVFARYTDAGSQFWLFMWAPVNGEGGQHRYGVFFIPLVMALLDEFG